MVGVNDISKDDTEHIDRHGRQANHPDEFRASPDEVEIFDEELAMGYLRRLEVLLNACPVKIFAASSLKHPWPYRLQNAAECYPASFWRSQDRIMDSGIHADLSNEDVLTHAVQRHATAVVAKDYLHDQQATTESINDFVRRHNPHHHGRAYIPLQPPYDEHIQTVYPIIEESHIPHRYMLGGLATAPVERRIDELLAFRREVGSGPVAHGLGWGLDDNLVATIRDEPGLLDSIDNSSPAQAAQNGQILDKHWRARDCPNVDGQYQNSVHGAFEFAMLVQATHRLTEFNDDFDGATEQSNLHEYGGVQADD